MYRVQTNSPASSNIQPSTLNKSPHGNNNSSSNSAGLYPPSSNSSIPPSIQQQRSPAGSVPSPSGPLTTSISPQNSTMNKTSTSQSTSVHLSSMSQQPRPYLPAQQIMQQHQNRIMNGTGIDHSSSGQVPSSCVPNQHSYIPHQQQSHSYSMQQNGYGHHPSSSMSQQHYSIYHQQQSKKIYFV